MLHRLPFPSSLCSSISVVQPRLPPLHSDPKPSSSLCFLSPSVFHTLPISTPAGLVLLKTVKNVEKLRLLSHTKLVGLLDADRHNRRRKASCVLLHDSVPWELRMERMTTTYTWDALCCTRNLIWGNQMLYPGKHRSFARSSLENHPPKPFSTETALEKNILNPRQPALYFWAVQTQNTVNVLDFFSLLFLSLLDQAVLPLTGPLWQLLTDPLNPDWMSLHFYPLYLVGVASGTQSGAVSLLIWIIFYPLFNSTYYTVGMILKRLARPLHEDTCKFVKYSVCFFLYHTTEILTNHVY